MTAQQLAKTTQRSLRAYLARLVRFGLHVAGRFHHDGCFAAAGALSYTTLVSLVPLLVIALAVISAFPLFESLRDQLLAIVFTNFVPEVGSTVELYISVFTASAGKTTAVGLVVFAATGVLLLATIEDRLNVIWRVHAPRRWIARLLVYWTVTTLGPFLLAAAVSLSFQLAAYRQQLGLAGEISRSVDGLLRDADVAIPFGAEFVGLFALFSLVPHCPVRWWDAFRGAVVSSILLEISKAIFAVYIGHFASYQAIYGALAAIPIFLLWTYFGWTIILFGAEIAAAAPYWVAEVEDRVPMATDMELALGVIDILARERRRGGVTSIKRLSLELRVPGGVIADCLDRLNQAGWVINGIGGGWVLSRDLDRMTLGDLTAALGTGREQVSASVGAPWRGRYVSALASLREAEAELAHLPVTTILGAGPDA